jgi:adenosylcobinamide-phosphate synthase
VSRRSSALAIAVTLDLAFGEPPRAWHPVSLAGRALAFGTDRLPGQNPARQLAGGAAVVVATSGLAALVGATVERAFKNGLAGTLIISAALKTLFAFRMLIGEAGMVAKALEEGRIDDARVALRSLVSRPTAELPPALVAAAAIESLAENLSDSVIAPWLLYATFGLPGAAVYRVVNTTDSMYGYRGECEWLGKAAARTDDLLNLVPSRLTAAAIVAAARLRLGKEAAACALATWRKDGGRTASPNAGRPMSAMAGALRRRLEKRGHYVLGAGFPEPTALDLRCGIEVTSAAAVVAFAVLLGALVAGGR